MRAFLEQSEGEWYDDFIYISKEPLKERDYTIVAFDGNDMENTLDTMKPTKEDIIVGTVQATSRFFDLIGVKTPGYLGYPESLKKYLGRDVSKVRFADLDKNYPYFIKPADDVKMFTGFVVKKDYDIEMLVKWSGKTPPTEDTMIYKSEVVDFVSEYRVFISNGKVYGMQFYNGDYLKFVDTSIIDKMIADYENPPSAYTLDIGLTSDGRTLLVEVNDMWAIGSYGLEPKHYALLCARRMKEIIRNYAVNHFFKVAAANRLVFYCFHFRLIYMFMV